MTKSVRLREVQIVFDSRLKGGRDSNEPVRVRIENCSVKQSVCEYVDVEKFGLFDLVAAAFGSVAGRPVAAEPLT